MGKAAIDPSDLQGKEDDYGRGRAIMDVEQVEKMDVPVESVRDEAKESDAEGRENVREEEATPRVDSLGAPSDLASELCLSADLAQQFERRV